MKDKPVRSIEERVAAWGKWLYACYGAALSLLLSAIIKAIENTKLVGMLFSIEEKAGAANLPIFAEHYTEIGFIVVSPWRLLLWAVLEIACLGMAVILIAQPAWRKAPSMKRTNLIFGYLMASWLTLLTLGAQDPINVGEVPGYNILVVGYLIAIGLGYWLIHRKKDRAEEIFP